MGIKIKMPEFNFTVKNNSFVDDEFLKILFENEEVIWLEPTVTMADILVIAGIYESKTRARKDGYNELPMGWFDKYIGNKKTRISIWNPVS
jgi:hypothetical protein